MFQPILFSGPKKFLISSLSSGSLVHSSLIRYDYYIRSTSLSMFLLINMLFMSFYGKIYYLRLCLHVVDPLPYCDIKKDETAWKT